MHTKKIVTIVTTVILLASVIAAKAGHNIISSQKEKEVKPPVESSQLDTVHEKTGENEAEQVEINPWESFQEYNNIGEDYITVTKDSGLEFNDLTEEAIGTIWQHETSIYPSGIDYILLNAKGMDLSFAFDQYSYDQICDGVGGNAGELFGIKEAVDIDTLMKEIGVYVEEDGTYTISWTTDLRDTSWQAYKSGDSNRFTDSDGMEYMYVIDIYSQGLTGLNWDFDLDLWPEEPVNTENIGTYYEDYDSDYNIVYPDTKVTISLQPVEDYY